MHLALEAGAELSDMELVQFHPTGMVSPEEMAGTLVTEAVRGEGADSSTRRVPGTWSGTTPSVWNSLRAIGWPWRTTPRSLRDAAVRYSATLGAQMRSPKVVREAHDDVNAVMRNGDEMVRPMQRNLRNIMWEHCGVVRDDHRMNDGLAKLKELREWIDSEEYAVAGRLLE